MTWVSKRIYSSILDLLVETISSQIMAYLYEDREKSLSISIVRVDIVPQNIQHCFFIFFLAVLSGNVVMLFNGISTFLPEGVLI